MIADALGAGAYLEALAALLVCAACFVAGVGWACYRAVGWVERMRAWALTVPVEPDGGLATQEVETMGVN